MDYKPEDQAARYAFVRKTAVKFDCHLLGCADRGCARAYIGKVCGFSPAQISRLLRQQAETGAVEDRRARNSGRPFETVYTPADIRRLAAVDEAFGGMSALATCEILRREFEVHGGARFERLAGISRSHVYNLRASRACDVHHRRGVFDQPAALAAAGEAGVQEHRHRPGFRELRQVGVQLVDRVGVEFRHVWVRIARQQVALAVALPRHAVARVEHHHVRAAGGVQVGLQVAFGALLVAERRHHLGLRGVA